MSINTQVEPEPPQTTVCKLCGLAVPKAWHIGYRTKDRIVDLHAWCVTEYEKTIGKR